MILIVTILVGLVLVLGGLLIRHILNNPNNYK